VAAPLALAQVTPYPWEEGGHERNGEIQRLATDLAGRGHRVLIVAPSSSHALVREGRRAIRAGGDALLPAPAGAPRVLAVGEALPGRTRAAALPIDVTRTLEELFAAAPLDLCHVHEPIGLNVATAALRHSRALNVGTFHTPLERLVATQVARRFAERVLGRLDARLTSYAATRDLMQRYFPAEYRVVAPALEAPDDAARRDGGAAVAVTRLLFVEHEERPALRLFLRALRLLEPVEGWEAVVVGHRGPSSSTPLRASVRERVRFATPDELAEDEALRSADVLVAASDGAAPAPGLVLRALAAGAVPVCSRLAVYEEVLEDGRLGLLFEPRDEATLAAQLERVILDAPLRARLAERVVPRPTAALAAELEDVYREVVSRRHDGRGDPAARKRLAGRPLIDVDLHMHTDHSSDCATPVEALLGAAREQGLGAIAVTDHNEISGAFEAQSKAAEFGVKVIVGEEVKTASQGEVIGLFLTERIPRGMTLAETVAEIRRQGGLVYVPHPFDRMHAVPDYEHLLTIVPDVDAIEVYNPRVAIGSFNEEAVRFAAKYRIVAGAGSDSHVTQGLGSVRIRMRDFDGPQEFLESLREADIIMKPSSLLYVQALKFLETKATPPAARRAVRERRVRRATRKP
jgi:glycosyltransferase involved in cell wall biosynthesis